MTKTTPILVGITSIALASTAMAATTLTYDWETGLDGWTVVSGNYAIQPSNGPGVSLGTPPGGHSQVFAPTPWANRDSDTTPLIFRSPALALDPNFPITVEMDGGDGSVALGITNDSALPTTTSDPGFQGIALRRVSDGAYFFPQGKSANGTAWETLTISATDIASIWQYGETYTVDILDLEHGGWGWIGISNVNVTVPEPSRAVLCLLASVTMLLRRSRA